MLLLAMLPLAAFAQELTDSAAVEALTWASPDAVSPGIVVKSKNGKFALGLGGQVKVTGSVDLGSPIDNPNEFFTSAIPSDLPAGNGVKWNGGAAQSFLYLNAVFMPGDKNQVGAYINFNFLGDNYAPVLQYAYLKWRGLTAGYAYTLFADNEAATSTIDYQGPNSFTGIQNVVVNYEGRLTRDGLLSGGIGLDVPMASAEDTPFSRLVNQRLPDIPAYLQCNWTDGHLRFSAILRNLYYRNELLNKNIDKVGWGIKLSGASQIAGGLSGFFQVMYGKGVTSYYQDLTDCSLDLVSNGHGDMSTLKSWGGYAGLNYDFTDRLHLSGSYSHIRLYPGKKMMMPELDTTYRWAQYAVGTLMYDFTDWLSGGVEYIYGRRMQLDGNQCHDNRFLVGIQASF